MPLKKRSTTISSSSMSKDLPILLTIRHPFNSECPMPPPRLINNSYFPAHFFHFCVHFLLTSAISSSTTSVYFPCATSLFLKEGNKEPPILFYKCFYFLQISITIFYSKLIYRLQFIGIFLNSPDVNRT